MSLGIGSGLRRFGCGSVRLADRAVVLLPCFLLLCLWPRSAEAQRFDGQFGGGGGFWVIYIAPELESERSFQRDLGGFIALGGRGFLQLGRVRLGGGSVTGNFIDEGVNQAGNDVTGEFAFTGFTAEYLLIQETVEVAVGGLVGGGNLTLEERLSVSGDVANLNQREESIFVGLPWARLGYNAAPFVNLGLEVGFLAGSEDLDGLSLGVDVVVGLIP